MNANDRSKTNAPLSENDSDGGQTHSRGRYTDDEERVRLWSALLEWVEAEVEESEYEWVRDSTVRGQS